MKRNKAQLLIIASDASAQAISKALSDFSGLKMIRANSDTDAVELMVTTTFAVVFMEEDLPEITPLKIAARLSDHGNSEMTPLVLITNSPMPLDRFKSFPSLLMDFLTKPVDPEILKVKIDIFFELYKNKTAVIQSINELDRVYGQIADHQKRSIKEQERGNKTANFSSAFAGQMQSPLKNIQAGVYQLQKARDLPPHLGQGVSHIRNAAVQIAGITKKISALVSRAPKQLTHLTDDTGAERPCYILHVTGTKDEFDIFRHYIKGALNCVLHSADTISRAKLIISAQKLDIIFIDPLLSDGTGLDLLSDLARLQSDIPVIFTTNNSQVNLGAKAVARGAHRFFIKEKISTRTIQSIIQETLERSRLAKEIKGTRERIALISRRDHLTRLYNRQCFDQALNTEMDKVRRYQSPLSILIVGFDKFKRLNQTHGYETGDQILTASAALIQSMVRNMDLVCRYGGDEFGILLSNTGLQGAKILAQRILKGISSQGFIINENAFPVTVSIGIASLETKAPSPYKENQDQARDQDQNQKIIQQALEALDLAMQQGGNTIQYLPKAESERTHD